MKNLTCLLGLIGLFVFAGCAEKELTPISGNKDKPDPIVVEKVESIPGGARIVYTIPGTPNLQMIKAFYTRSNGEKQVAAVSKYENSLLITGYNDTDEHDVVLRAVSDAMIESDPVTIKIRPDISPLKKIQESMQILPDFGGARFTWENEEKVPVTIDLLAADDKGILKLSRIHYSSATTSYQALRGYEPIARTFAAVVRDMFGNESDTIYPAGKILTPILEMEVDKKKMSMYTVKGDGDFNIYGTRDFWMFDGDVNTFAHSSAPPAIFTFDLGRPVKLSRFKVWNRYFENNYYHWGNLRFFKVYGRLDVPSKDGNWDEWALIANCEEVKPSGIVNTKEMTNEDIAVAEAGFEFEIGFDIPPVRYLRFSVEQTWSGTSFAHPAEFSFWGQYE